MICHGDLIGDSRFQETLKLLSREEITYSLVWNRVNLSLNTPGIRTLSLAKMTNCPTSPSNVRNLSGVCTTSPALASAPVGVLTGVNLVGVSESRG
jgi:hypothetical protein